MNTTNSNLNQKILSIDSILNELGDNNKDKFLYQIVKRKLSDQENHFVAIIKKLVESGDLHDACSIAEEWNYKGILFSLFSSLANGCDCRHAHSAANENRQQAIKFLKESETGKPTPESLNEILKNATNYEELHEYDSVNFEQQNNNSEQNPQQIKDAAETLKQAANLLKNIGYSHRAGDLIDTFLFGKNVESSKLGQSSYLDIMPNDLESFCELGDLGIECYEDENENSKIRKFNSIFSLGCEPFYLGGGDLAASMAIELGCRNKKEKAKYFLEKALNIYEKDGAWHKALKLSKEFKDKKKENLYENIINILREQ